MEKSLIMFTVEKSEDVLEATIYADENISDECKQEFNDLIVKNILNKLPDELAAYHYENSIPVFNLTLTAEGVICTSLYLGFVNKKFKLKLKELTNKLVVDLKNSFNQGNISSEYKKQNKKNKKLLN